MDAYVKRLLKKGNSLFAEPFANNKFLCAYCGDDWHVIDACPILYDPVYMLGGEKFGCIPTYDEWCESQIWCTQCFKLGHESENCSKNIVNKNPEHEYVTNHHDNDYDTDLSMYDDNFGVSSTTVGNFGVEWENFVQSQNVLCKDCLRQINFCDACTKKHFDSKWEKFENLAEDLLENQLYPAIEEVFKDLVTEYWKNVIRGYVGLRILAEESQESFSSVPQPLDIVDNAGLGDVERGSVGTSQESLPLVDSPPTPQHTLPSNMFDDWLDFVIGKDTNSFNISMFTNLSFLKHICGRKFFDKKSHTNCSHLFYGITSSNLFYVSIFNEKLRALHRRVLKFLTPPRSRFK